MDEKLKAENEALRELFQHHGWAVLMRNTQALLDQFTSGFPFNVHTVEQLYYSRGMVGALKSLLAMPEQLEAAEKAEQEQEYEDDSV